MAEPPTFPATCPGCEATHQIPVTMAGMLVTCEKCQTGFILPETKSEPPPPESTRYPVLKNALLLVSGAALVWGGSLYFQHRRARETADSAPGPGPETISAPGKAAPVTPPPARFTSINKKPPASPSSPAPDPAAGLPTVPVPTPPLPEIPPPPPALPTPPPLVTPAIAEEKPPAAPAAPAPPAAALPDPARLRKDSRLTLESFLRASTMEERLALSQHAGKIRQEMEEHYRTHPAGPLPLEEIAFLTEGEVPDTKRKFHLYNVVLKDQEAAIPMAVEETEDGYRVDWPTFAECYTHRLRDFFAAPSEPPGRFRVMLRRAHYFGPAVPGQDTVRIAYTVEPPGRDDSFHVWVDKDSPVYKEKLAKGDRAGWDAESYVIVELIWKEDAEKGRWVSLRRIAGNSWRTE